MKKLQTTIAQGRRRQQVNENIYYDLKLGNKHYGFWASEINVIDQSCKEVIVKSLEKLIKALK